MTGSQLFLIDLTATIESNLNTGIQRVSKEFAMNLSKISTPNASQKFLPIFCHVTIFGRPLIYLIHSIPCEVPRYEVQGNLLIFKVRKWVRETKIMRLFVIKFVQRTYLSRFYSKILLTKLQIDGIVETIPLKSETNYELIFIDQFWNSPASLKIQREFKQKKKPISVFVHDILPITHPKYFERDASSHFKRVVPDVLESARRIFVASDSVKKAIQNLLINEKEIVKINLGSDLSEKNVVLSTETLKTEKKFFLQVGTIEPRKNHEQVLRWYLRGNFAENLVIVGNLGWNSGKLRELLLKSIDENQGKILWLREIDDRKLKNLIQESSIGICASHVEGYNLPLREFLYHGKPVVASDIPAHRDETLNTALDLIHFFVLNDDSSFDRAITRARSSMKKKQTNLHLKTWKEAAERFADLLKT